MAETGRREQVNDPLANNAFAQMPDRSLSTMGVRNPGQTSGMPNDPGFEAIGQLASVLGEIAESQKEDWITEGKIAFMQGRTEEDISKTGNMYTMQGWQSLNAADAAARWYTQETIDLQNGAYSQDPQAYSKGLMERRAQFMNNLPEDPAVRKLFAAAFDDYGPRLASQHMELNNAYNTDQTTENFKRLLDSGSHANADAPRVMPGEPLRLSPGIVRPTVSYNDDDVEHLALTMLGEAAGEGPTGMAAVAHTVMNRAIDGGYGGKSIKEVILADKQFSTWNTGPGGNNPQQHKGTRAYEHARQIAMNVLSGHHVDPTNGATHYYAPEGMEALVRAGHQTNLKPTWWDSVTANTGSITIGGHVFGGRARGLAGNPQGKGLARLVPPEGATASGGGLKFSKEWQSSIDEGFANTLRDVSNVLGKELNITSGYRDPEYNKKIGSGRGSMHTKGQAVDISMRGMSNGERAALVQNLRARGVTRFITYSNMPDTLHVDLGQPGQDRAGNVLETRFMHDKSIDYLDKAPDWFKALSGTPIPPIDPAQAPTGGVEATEVVADGADGIQVAEASGIPTAETPSGPQTQVQELLRNFGNLNPQRRGQAVAEVMQQQFARGEDTLWEQAGGIGILRELGAPEDVIHKTQIARTAYEDKQLNGWNLDRLKKENDVITSVGAGNMSADEALQWLDSEVSARRMTEEHAKTVANKVLAESQKVGKQAVTDPGAMRGVTEVFRGIITGAMTPEQGDLRIRQIAAVYDMPETQLRSFLGDMWQEEKSGIRKTQTAIEAAGRKQVEQDRRKLMVERALANGTGLNEIDGKIEVEDPKYGTTREVSAAQYGVETLRSQITAQANIRAKELVQMGMDQNTANDQATAEGELNMYSQLRKHDVVDEAGVNKIRGGLLGEIVKDGKVNPAAAEALDWIARMANSPQVGEEYIAKYLPDNQTADLVATARTLMEGNYDVEDALLRAHTMLNDPNVDTQRKISSDGVFTGKLASTVNETFDTLIGDSLLNKMVGPLFGDHLFRAEDAQAIRQDNRQRLSSEVTRRAQAFYMQNPRMTAEAALKRAAVEVQRDATIVGNNIVFGDATKGETLAQTMGLSKFGPRAVTDAMEYVLEQDGEALFGALYKQHQNHPSYTGRIIDNLTLGATSGEGLMHRPFESMRRVPRYDVQYVPNGDDSFLTVQLLNNDGMPVGTPVALDAARLGQKYLDETGAKEASWATRGIMLGVDAVADQIEQMPEREPNPALQWLDNLSGGRLTDRLN